MFPAVRVVWGVCLPLAQVDAERALPSIRALQEMRVQAVSLQLSNEAAIGIIGK